MIIFYAVYKVAETVAKALDDFTDELQELGQDAGKWVRDCLDDDDSDEGED